MLSHHVFHQRFAEVDQLRRLVSQILQLEGNLRLKVKDGSRQRHHICRGLSLVHAEELKIPAEVEDIELVLIHVV